MQVSVDAKETAVNMGSPWQMTVPLTPLVAVPSQDSACGGENPSCQWLGDAWRLVAWMPTEVLQHEKVAKLQQAVALPMQALSHFQEACLSNLCPWRRHCRQALWATSLSKLSMHALQGVDC